MRNTDNLSPIYWDIENECFLNESFIPMSKSEARWCAEKHGEKTTLQLADLANQAVLDDPEYQHRTKPPVWFTPKDME